MFHEITLELYFMKCSERKISQCTLKKQSVWKTLIFDLVTIFHNTIRNNKRNNKSISWILEIKTNQRIRIAKFSIENIQFRENFISIFLTNHIYCSESTIKMKSSLGSISDSNNHKIFCCYLAVICFC